MAQGASLCCPFLTTALWVSLVRLVHHKDSRVNPNVRAGPNAIFIPPDPANHYVLACDLGLDKVLIYRLKGNPATLQPNEPPGTSIQPGAGPRHLAFSPEGT